MLRFVPGLPRSVGFRPIFFPPEAGFAHRTVRRLPLPEHRVEFLTPRDHHRPDPLHDTVLVPALEPTMHRAVVAELDGQLVPLTARSQSKNDAVQNPPPIGSRSSRGTRRSILQQDRFNQLPQVIRHRPNHRQHAGLPFLRALRHPWFSSAITGWGVV